MKVAILGAGISGLTAAYELNKQGHEVWIFEKESLPGGAASGFKKEGWDWYLDFYYHHWFTNDHDILNLAKEIGFDKIIQKRPITASLYSNKFVIKKLTNSRINELQTKDSMRESVNSLINNNELFNELFGPDNEIIKLDSAFDLLRFDRLPLFDRLRTGAILAFLKYGPKFSFYDRLSTEEFLIHSMGKKAYEMLWEPLMKKKFPKVYAKINAAFIWTRVNKRTETLCYPEGGFQAFANYFAEYLMKKGVKIKYNCEIGSIQKSINGNFTLSLQGGFNPANTSRRVKPFCADMLINTLPTPIFLKLEKNVLPQNYRKRLEKIKYLGAQTVILESKEPILPNHTYWLNILDPKNPWTVAVQHTNFMDKKHFNNKHLLYIGQYSNKQLDINLLTNSRINELQTKDSIREFVNSLIINNQFIKYAQPLYTNEFVKVKPDYTTPVANLYFANLELTYPYDRGTNYAVKMGKEVSKRMVK